MSILSSRRLAVFVSWIGHPLVFVTISIGIVVTMQLASRAAIPLLAALFLSVIAPILNTQAIEGNRPYPGAVVCADGKCFMQYSSPSRATRNSRFASLNSVAPQTAHL